MKNSPDAARAIAAMRVQQRFIFIQKPAWLGGGVVGLKAYPPPYRPTHTRVSKRVVTWSPTLPTTQTFYNNINIFFNNNNFFFYQHNNFVYV